LVLAVDFNQGNLRKQLRSDYEFINSTYKALTIAKARAYEF